jgi:hypothetical protein
MDPIAVSSRRKKAGDPSLPRLQLVVNAAMWSVTYATTSYSQWHDGTKLLFTQWPRLRHRYFDDGTGGDHRERTTHPPMTSNSRFSNKASFPFRPRFWKSSGVSSGNIVLTAPQPVFTRLSLGLLLPAVKRCRSYPESCGAQPCRGSSCPLQHSQIQLLRSTHPTSKLSAASSIDSGPQSKVPFCARRRAAPNAHAREGCCRNSLAVYFWHRG